MYIDNIIFFTPQYYIFFSVINQYRNIMLGTYHAFPCFVVYFWWSKRTELYSGYSQIIHLIVFCPCFIFNMKNIYEVSFIKIKRIFRQIWKYLVDKIVCSESKNIMFLFWIIFDVFLNFTRIWMIYHRFIKIPSYSAKFI